MVKGQWSEVSTTGHLQRSSHSVSIVASHVFINGGEIRSREPVEAGLMTVNLDGQSYLDRAKVEVTPRRLSRLKTVESSSGPSPRVGLAVTALGDKLYLFSGRGGPSMVPLEENGTIWVFDTVTATWSVLAPCADNEDFPKGRSYHALTNDGRATIYLHAGCPEKGRLRDFWSLDTEKQKWKRLADAPGPSRGGSSIAFSNGKVYRMNGFDGNVEQGGTLEIYEIESDNWSTINYQADGLSGPAARSVSCLLAVNNSGKKFLVTVLGESDPSNLGHQGAGKMLEDAWAFDIASSTWSQIEVVGPARPAARGWFGADVWHSAIVVHGGLSESNERLGDIWMLQLET